MTSETNELPTVAANPSGHTQRFPVLEGMAKFWRVGGWITMITGVVLAIFTIGDALSSNYGWREWHTFQIIVSAGLLFVGTILVAIGEFVGVFLAIEANTRQTAELLGGGQSDMPTAHPVGPHSRQASDENVHAAEASTPSVRLSPKEMGDLVDQFPK